jgi:predicted PurR-regulated permease PerM
MSGSDLALVLATVALLAVFVVLVVVLAAVLRGLRDVRDTLDAVRARALPLLDDLAATVEHAGAEVDKVDDLLDTAVAIQHTVDSASRLTYVAVANPLIKVVAFFRGLGRGVGRAFGRGGRRRRRIEARRGDRLAREAA